MRNRRLRLLHAFHSARCWIAFAAWIALVVLIDHGASPTGAAAGGVATILSLATLGVALSAPARARAPSVELACVRSARASTKGAARCPAIR